MSGERTIYDPRTEKPVFGGWLLTVDERLPEHQLYSKELSFELSDDIKSATIAVHVEGGVKISKIDFTFFDGDHNFADTAEFHFSKKEQLIAPLDLKPNLREEFKAKVGSLTADFFVLSGNMHNLASLNLLAATRQLKELKVYTIQDWWDHLLID